MIDRKLYRQGDVAILTNTSAAGSSPVPADGNRIVLAHGEVTGHHHSFPLGPQVAIFRDDGLGGGLIVRVAEPAPLEHQEHTAHVIPAGTHEVLRQVEWSDADEPVQVED